MKTDIVLYRPMNALGLFEIPKVEVRLNFNAMKEVNCELPEVLFVTTFPPRECGIATYSQDLITALKLQFNESFTCTFCALETDTEQHAYFQKPKFILNTDQKNSFVKTAFNINRDPSIELVVIQHEFGFFDSREEDFFLFLEAISKPIIFVFHTVLPEPTPKMHEKVNNMANLAASIIVMTNNASKILTDVYGIASYKITVIPHGTHLVPPLQKKNLKKYYNLENHRVLTTFGLLSKSKSIETTLNALPEIISKHPDVLFLILGKTHPTVAKHEGEQYRDMLKEKVMALKLTEHVRFVNEYLPLHKLLEYLQLTDIYLFTSKDPHQAVSGTFAYAMSCGCPVVSTPIPHAKEVLSDNSGIIFDFENSEQLAASVVKLLDNKILLDMISSNSFHKMAATAWENSAIAHAKLFEKQAIHPFQLTFALPKISLDHVKKMTTDIGIIQFSKISEPDIHSGYTLDDNARALIAMCQHYVLFPKENHLRLINNYLEFIRFCLQPNGSFLNYVNESKEFTSQNDAENLEDSFGRAIWALGYVSSLKNYLPLNLTNEADNLIERSISHLHKMHSTRAMAFIIKGLHYQNRTKNLELLCVLADRLENMYKHEKSAEWLWFESYLTYGNSLLPEAMLCAYLSTNIESYKDCAKESFDFLLSKTFIDGKIKVISNKGWLTKNVKQEVQIGGEQPIDVAYAVMALERFHAVFNKDSYANKAHVAYSWFLGNNHLNQIVYNPCTGGCYDGLEEFNVNLNQGAESTVSHLMARLSMERLNQHEKLKKRISGLAKSRANEVHKYTSNLA